MTALMYALKREDGTIIERVPASVLRKLTDAKFDAKGDKLFVTHRGETRVYEVEMGL